ncbi:dihydroneopterin aldolase [Lentibacillus sediminis]|uniref:dihydroneopterin aldolase n=1 Tax=Lentibacillus sediminis TaxID=1940529 RepID=UPI000C1C3B1D|nr:dihydroneopterin aldolase [Lentibacillus sediminis]
MDKIMLNGMKFYGFHGLLPEENKLGQRFQVDTELFLDLTKPGQSDQMDDSIHYGQAYDLVKEIVEGEAKQLLESVADTIAARLLEEFSLLAACTVRVTKPDPPIAGHYDSVAVEIYREREHE